MNIMIQIDSSQIQTLSQTRFIIVRHGETEWNVQEREMGQLDSPLTPNGLAQAMQLAARLEDVHLAAFYSSDLGRAAATSAMIAKRRAIEVSFDIRLRERNMGIFQGLTVAGMRDRHPKERADYERIGFDYVIPGGESARQRVERTMTCLNELAVRHQGGTVLIVTHGGILTGLFQHVLGMSPESSRRFRRPNAAVNVFICEEGQWILETWGDISHLAGIATLDDPAEKTGY